MRRSVVVAVCASVVAVVATAGLAVALTNDDDNRPGMMSSNVQGRGTGGPGGPGLGRGTMMQGPGLGAMMGAGMHVVVRSEHGFLVRMIAHHEEAIEAAGELSRSDRPEMRELGRSIVADQTAQVEQMRAWLQEWYPDRSGHTAYRPMMRDLSGLSGDRLDLVFLEDMIGHHMAAVMMSQQLVVRGLAEHDEVADLARSISASQRAEILTMRRWLWQWFA
ncbi:DUF305 domain-containing protein [Nocardioides sp. Soil805]|uniref:DUF305 domain-containing protein n=1 Tax=Nocardioides sp. Soil805 TaxID=1736416 RepID=UPI0007027690|nr:DUF305 domain-containing protein [Nocardioides sp. Soil805]KRF37573.1 hypothetical protein ASG94_09785 [Nocardioides sp. Soil805]